MSEWFMLVLLYAWLAGALYVLYRMHQFFDQLFKPFLASATLIAKNMDRLNQQVERVLEENLTME